MPKLTAYLRVTKARASSSKGVDAKHGAGKASAWEERPVGATKKALHGDPRDEDEDDDEEYDEHGQHVPRFIYKAVQYKRRTAPHAVSSREQQIAAFILEHYELPNDFEPSCKYGPHSGMTFEQRLLRAYKFGLLPRKYPDASPPPMICTTCAHCGHVARACPEGF